MSTFSLLLAIKIPINLLLQINIYIYMYPLPTVKITYQGKPLSDKYYNEHPEIH